MSRSRRWTRFLPGLMLGLMACLSWLTVYSAALEPAARPPTGPPLSVGGLHGDMRPKADAHWQLVAQATPNALEAEPSASMPASAGGSQGVEFWLTFPGNVRYIPSQFLELSLIITAHLSTSGTVSIPGLGFSMPFTVMAGAVTRVPLPPAAALSSVDLVENNGIHVTALDYVSVYGLSRVRPSAGAYLALPTPSLGTQYIVLAYENFGSLTGSQFAIVATADETSVTITPSVTTGERPGKISYRMTLQRGQTYQLRNSDPHDNDLSGTVITADKPIAVFAGHECARVPSEVPLCDYLVEQLPPVSMWGRTFATMPLAGRSGGDTFRFMASADGTKVRVNGELLATLKRGRFLEHRLPTPAHITSNYPILVAQYANGIHFDQMTGDPFMMLIPPLEQFLDEYTITALSSDFESNFVNVVAPRAAIDTITLDGVTIEAERFVPIGESGFSGAQVLISQGSHHLTGALPFGTAVYGFSVAASYGYPGGIARTPGGIVARFELTPETATNPIDTEHCVTAIVGDREGNPIVGLDVDFMISGANPTAGLVITAENGQAEFCYRGPNPGTDSIVASVEAMTDTATKVWVARVLRFSDGRNTLTVDSANSVFSLSYLVDAIPHLCSGNGASVEAGLLTITGLCQEDPRDVLRATGPADASVTVQLIDHQGTTGGSPDIRHFILTRLSDMH